MIEDGTDDFSILNTLKIDCQDLCDELRQKLQQPEAVVSVFKHGSDDQMELVGLE